MTQLQTISCGMVNCWLLKDETGSVLVDTAVVRYKDMILHTVKDANVKLIFLTHGHVDHTGNAAYLSERLGAPVGICEADTELLRKNNARLLYADTFLGKIILGGTRRNLYTAPAFTPSLFFEGGEDLGEYGVDAEVIALPGHTRGSLGLLVNGVDLIAGDAMFNVLRPTAARIFEDRTAMLESLDIIKGTACKTIHVAHGRPVPADSFFAGFQNGKA